MAQGDEFFVSQEAFKEAVLGPLTKTTQGFVYSGTTLVVGDVVGYQVEHVMNYKGRISLHLTFYLVIKGG